MLLDRIEENRYEDLERLLDWIRVPLSLVGVWPLEKEKTTYFRFIGWIVYFVVHLSMAYADFVAVFGHLELMILNFMETGLQSMILVRLMVFRCSKILPRIIVAAKEDMRDDNYESQEEKDIYLRYYSSAVSFFKTVTSFACCTTVMYCIKPIQEYYVSALKNESSMLMTPYRVRAFFDLNEMRNVVLVYIFQIPIMCTAIFYVASIGLLVALVFNVCGQLSVLSYRVMNFNPSQRDSASSIFRYFVARHLRIIWMAKSIESVFHMVLLNELVGTTVVLGLIAYNTLTTIDNAEGAALAVFGFYALTMMVLIYGNCLVGEHLNFESTRLRDAFYQCNWYEMPLTYRKALLICLLQAQTPLELTAGGFYPFSLSSFTDIIKKSMAYMSMLRTVAVK